MNTSNAHNLPNIPSLWDYFISVFPPLLRDGPNAILAYDNQKLWFSEPSVKLWLKDPSNYRLNHDYPEVSVDEVREMSLEALVLYKDFLLPSHTAKDATFSEANAKQWVCPKHIEAFLEQEWRKAEEEISSEEDGSFSSLTPSLMTSDSFEYPSGSSTAFPSLALTCQESWEDRAVRPSVYIYWGPPASTIYDAFTQSVICETPDNP